MKVFDLVRRMTVMTGLILTVAVAGGYLMGEFVGLASAERKVSPDSTTGIDECIDYGSYDDADDDGWNVCFEGLYGSDPGNQLSVPEHLLFDSLFETNTCGDGADNDLDGALDADDTGCTIPHECLGPLRSAFNRSGWTFSLRHPDTGETLFFGHYNKEFNPGDYRGTAGWDDFIRLFSLLARSGCLLPIPRTVFIWDCIDFSGGDPCPPSDVDRDGVLDFVEIRLGSNPNDGASTPELALLDEQSGSGTCRDGSDNDLDGRKDRGDAGCTVTCKDFGGRGRCTDPDGDGWLTYVEIWRGSDPYDSTSTPDNPGDCIDFDNSTTCGP